MSYRNEEFEENNRKQRELRVRLLEEISKSGLSVFWVDYVLDDLKDYVRNLTPAIPDISVLRYRSGTSG